MKLSRTISNTSPVGESVTVDPEPDIVIIEDNDPKELHELVSNFAESVYRLSLSILKDRALAEDVTQETLLKAWLALPSFRGDASLKNWVLRIGYNTSVSALRNRRVISTDPHELPDLVNPKDSVERKVENQAVFEEFVSALDLLDELSRSIVVLREQEGLSYDEIANILDVPIPTVKTRLMRARRRLSVALQGWAS